MSVYVFGPREHDSVCRQRAGHPPVLCGCRALDIEPAAANDRADVAHTRLGFALLIALFRPIDRNVA